MIFVRKYIDLDEKIKFWICFRIRMTSIVVSQGMWRRYVFCRNFMWTDIERQSVKKDELDLTVASGFSLRNIKYMHMRKFGQCWLDYEIVQRAVAQILTPSLPNLVCLQDREGWRFILTRPNTLPDSGRLFEKLPEEKTIKNTRIRRILYKYDIF